MKKRKTKKVSMFDVILTVIMVVFCAAIILPFVHMFAISFSSYGPIIRNEVIFVPKGFTLDRYIDFLSYYKYFAKSYGNTIIITVVGTFLALSVTAMAAYALSFQRFTGRKVFTALVVIPLFFSAGVAPNYILVFKLGLQDNLWALILPGMISSWNLLIMRSFFQSFPRETVESGHLDGLNDAGAFFRLVLPASKAALATIGLYYAVSYWNDYMRARLYLSTIDMWPLQAVLADVSADYGTTNCWGLGRDNVIDRVCGFVLVSLPTLLVYPFIQKYFIGGVTVEFVKNGSGKSRICVKTGIEKAGMAEKKR